MAKKKKNKPPVFKYIVKRKQKRKDGKKVYYYYSHTDKKQVSKSDYNEALKTRDKFKKTFGKNYLKKFKSGITEIKKVEKGQKQAERLTTKQEVEAYMKKNGFPIDFGYSINYSGYYDVEKYTIDKNVSYMLIKYYGRYYIMTEEKLLDAMSFFFYVLDAFYSYLSKTIPKKKKELTPHVQWKIDEIINSVDYPDMFALNLEQSQTSEGLQGAVTYFKKLVREGFNEYLFDLPVVEDLYELIATTKRK